MADSLDVTNPEMNPRKKRRMIGSGESQARISADAELRIYSSKLVDALRHLRRSVPSVEPGLAVRDAADRALAVSAKGKTRWSRAILTRKLSLRLSQINRKHKKATKPIAAKPPLKKPAVDEKLPPVQRKVRVLSRIVPGCQKLTLPSLLEETTSYIAALEMQVKAMSLIAGFLNGGGGGVAAPSHRPSS